MEESCELQGFEEPENHELPGVGGDKRNSRRLASEEIVAPSEEFYRRGGEERAHELTLGRKEKKEVHDDLQRQTLVLGGTPRVSGTSVAERVAEALAGSIRLLGEDPERVVAKQISLRSRILISPPLEVFPKIENDFNYARRSEEISLGLLTSGASLSRKNHRVSIRDCENCWSYAGVFSGFQLMHLEISVLLNELQELSTLDSLEGGARSGVRIWCRPGEYDFSPSSEDPDALLLGTLTPRFGQWSRFEESSLPRYEFSLTTDACEWSCVYRIIARLHFRFRWKDP